MAVETIQEVFARLTCDYGYKNYSVALLDLLEGVDDGSAEDSVKRMSQSIGEAFYVFNLLTNDGPDESATRKHPTNLRALHDYFFKKLYHIGIYCRKLIEVIVEAAGADDHEAYIKRQCKALSLSDGDSESLAQDWVEEDGAICGGLMEGRLRIMVFSGRETCFLLRNQAGDSVGLTSSSLQTENGLIISKYYALVRLIEVLHHIELLAKLAALGRGRGWETVEPEIVEIEEMDGVIRVAQELFSREV